MAVVERIGVRDGLHSSSELDCSACILGNVIEVRDIVVESDVMCGIIDLSTIWPLYGSLYVFGCGRHDGVGEILNPMCKTVVYSHLS